MVPTAYKFDTLLQKILCFEFKSEMSTKNIFLSITGLHYKDWGSLLFIPWVNLVLDGKVCSHPTRSACYMNLSSVA